MAEPMACGIILVESGSFRLQEGPINFLATSFLQLGCDLGSLATSPEAWNVHVRQINVCRDRLATRERVMPAPFDVQLGL
jgi:hypothetical protein